MTLPRLSTMGPCIVPVNAQQPHGNQHNNPPSEAARMRQRSKQISIGKSTQGYDNYLRAVPREERIDGVHLNTPSVSPTSNMTTSKREFECVLRAWRKFLHTYDNVEDETAPDHSSDSDSEGVSSRTVTPPSNPAEDFPCAPVEEPRDLSDEMRSHWMADESSTAWYYSCTAGEGRSDVDEDIYKADDGAWNVGRDVHHGDQMYNEGHAIDGYEEMVPGYHPSEECPAAGVYMPLSHGMGYDEPMYGGYMPGAYMVPPLHACAMDFPVDPEVPSPPEEEPAYDPSALTEGTPMTNLDALSAVLIALN